MWFHSAGRKGTSITRELMTLESTAKRKGSVISFFQHTVLTRTHLVRSRPVDVDLETHSAVAMVPDMAIPIVRENKKPTNSCTEECQTVPCQSASLIEYDHKVLKGHC
jgi:hypothetical protein